MSGEELRAESENLARCMRHPHRAVMGPCERCGTFVCLQCSDYDETGRYCFDCFAFRPRPDILRLTPGMGVGIASLPMMLGRKPLIVFGIILASVAAWSFVDVAALLGVFSSLDHDGQQQALLALGATGVEGLASVVLLVLMFNRKRVFPALATVYVVLRAILIAAGLVLRETTPHDAVWIQAIWPVAVACVLVPYLRSEAVRMTFVR